MNEVLICKALSSESRWKILQLLLRRPLSIKEIAEEVGLKPITVHHHVRGLMQIGLIESSEEIKGTVGRPGARYRVVGKPIFISIPKRNYEFLSELLEMAIVSSLGKEKAKETLNKIGREMGKNIVKNLARENNIDHWTSEAVKDFVIDGMLREMGAEPEVVKMTDKEIVYREYNCLFLERALKNPDAICEGLDDGFFGGLVQEIGTGIVGKKNKCRGHGDEYCEYSIKWTDN